MHIEGVSLKCAVTVLIIVIILVTIGLLLFYGAEQMYVCLCHGVTDTQIENAIDDGATTMKQLSAELKVGSQCGKCCQTTKGVLNNKLMQIAEPMSQVA